MDTLVHKTPPTAIRWMRCVFFLHPRVSPASYYQREEGRCPCSLRYKCRQRAPYAPVPTAVYAPTDATRTDHVGEECHYTSACCRLPVTMAERPSNYKQPTQELTTKRLGKALGHEIIDKVSKGHALRQAQQRARQMAGSQHVPMRVAHRDLDQRELEYLKAVTQYDVKVVIEAKGEREWRRLDGQPPNPDLDQRIAALEAQLKCNSKRCKRLERILGVRPAGQKVSMPLEPVAPPQPVKRPRLKSVIVVPAK
jgi:hypothetical protein